MDGLRWRGSGQRRLALDASCEVGLYPMVAAVSSHGAAKRCETYGRPAEVGQILNDKSASLFDFPGYPVIRVKGSSFRPIGTRFSFAGQGRYDSAS
jgi:hypothetical protein